MAQRFDDFILKINHLGPGDFFSHSFVEYFTLAQWIRVSPFLHDASCTSDAIRCNRGETAIEISQNSQFMEAPTPVCGGRFCWFLRVLGAVRQCLL